MQPCWRLSQPPAPVIGIDARAAAEEGAGRGRVVRELLRTLSQRPDDGRRFVLFARERWSEGNLDGRFSWRLISAPDPLWHLRTALAASRSCDVFLSSNSYLTVLFLRIPSVTVVYDLATFVPEMRPKRRSVAIERATLGPAVRRSAVLLAISQATATALEQHFPAAAGKTIVAPLGVTPLEARLAPEQAASLPPAGFVLAVGTLEPRKNLPRLVEAYARLDEQLQARHPLVVVGRIGWETGETMDALRSLGDRCLVLGFVEDAQLAELYRRCAVFCYPSLGEGFGLPVLEAMSAGAPVITSDLSSLPEVGGDAVDYVDPRSTEQIAAALERALSDEAHRARLSRLALERSQRFSWERFGDVTLASLDRAAGARAGAAPS